MPSLPPAPQPLSEPSACIEDALHAYRTSSTAWEKATDYLRPSTRTLSDPGLTLHTVNPLPSAFTAQFQNVQYKSFMGLFPSIRRAWLTVDSKLFLWAYAPYPHDLHHPVTHPDLYVYEGLSQIIVSVALVPPRPAVFVDSVQFLLAVATPVEVTLLGVAFSPTGEISLLPTNISVATDNVLMLKLTATPDGRIFMAGADGSLHEFAYAARASSGLLDLLSGRPAKRARKLVHNAAPFAHSLIPAAVKSLFAKADELVDLVVDPHRSALYTLSQAGVLTVYDLAEAKTRCVASLDVADVSRREVANNIPPADREYVSIHAVSRTASATVHLIVVTSFGERIYFSSMPSSYSSMVSMSSTAGGRAPPSTPRPRTLLFVGYRPSPDRVINRASRPCVHIAYCEKGAAIFADLREDESDRLIAVYPDANVRAAAAGHRDGRPGASHTAEVVFETTLGAAEASAGYGAAQDTSLGMGTPGTRRNAYGVIGAAPDSVKRTFAIAEADGDGLSGSQMDDDSPVDPPGFFWVLTSTAMHLYERVQPIVRLKQILSSGGGAASDIEAFFARHGAAESCAMCLEIAITHSALRGPAAHVFYTYGGDPQFDPHLLAEPQPRSRPERSNFSQPLSGGGRSGRQARSNSFDIGRPTLQSGPMSRFSGAHDGASLYLAKALHPVWDKYITSNRDPEGYQALGAPKELISAIRDELLSVIGFLENYTPDVMLPNIPAATAAQQGGGGGPQPERPQSLHLGGSSDGTGRETAGSQTPMFRGLLQVQQTSEARHIESKSIIALKQLCVRTVEALALLLILSDHQLHRLVVCMPEESRRVLCQMRLCDLVVEEHGAAVSASLIETIFASYADGAGAVVRVGQILKERCGSYFGDSDIELHRGLATLHEAVEIVSSLREDGYGGTEVADQNYNGGRGSVELNPRYGPAMNAAQNLAEEAARVLKVVPNRIFDIRSVCQDFRTVRAYPSLVDVALTVGRVAESAGNQVRMMAAYEAILEALRPLVHTSDGGGGPDLDASSLEDIDRLRDAGMRVAFSAKSAVFLQMLYRFLLESKRGEETLLEHSSPGLEKFLEESEALDLLWRYFARHGRFLEAAGVLMHLSESKSDLALIDRLNYLSCALHNSKTAASKGDSRAASLLTEVSDFMDVARVQLRVREELLRQHAQSPEIDAALKELDGSILDLSTLFNKYARPFNLYEASLETFRCGSYRDDAYVRGLWTEIVEREAAVAKTPALLGQKIQALGRDFYPSDVTFPTGYIVDLLERLVYRNASIVIWRDAVDWVCRTMKSIGVPLSDLIDGYRRMIENPGQAMGSEEPWSWTEESAQLHLLRATERVISLWTSEHNVGEMHNTVGFDQGKRGVLTESDKALQAITLCKSRLRGMSSTACAALVQRFEALERRISPLVQ